MKINEEKSILYSNNIKLFKLVFMDINSAGTFIGVCCYVNGLKDVSPKFFESSNENEVQLDLSGMLKDNGGYDLTIIPIYDNGGRQEPKDKIEPVPHIYLGKCTLGLRERSSTEEGIIGEFYCKQDQKIKMDNLGFRWAYTDSTSPAESEYHTYIHSKGTSPLRKNRNNRCFILFKKEKEYYSSVFNEIVEINF